MQGSGLSRRGFLSGSLGAMAAAGLPAWYARELLAAERGGRPHQEASPPTTRSRRPDRLRRPGPRRHGPPAADKNVEVVAVCDVDKNHRDEAPPRNRQRRRLQRQYEDFRELLDRKDIDAVIIATPDHWHALIAIDAMQTGKDVYCEKPLTLTVDEGQALREGGQGDRPRPPDRQPAALRRPRSAWPASWSATAGSARSRPSRRRIGGNPPSGPFPDAPVPEGLDWDFWLGPTPEGRLRQQGKHELPLRVPLVVRVLRRQDDRLGRPPQRHRPVGPGHGRQRPGRRRGRRRRAAARSRNGYNCHPTFKVTYTYANGAKAASAPSDGENGVQLRGRGRQVDLRQPRQDRGQRPEAARRAARRRRHAAVRLQRPHGQLPRLRPRAASSRSATSRSATAR